MHIFKDKMAERNKLIIVICEGHSEESYLIELSKVLREARIPVKFCPKLAGGGHFKTLAKKYKEIKRHERKSAKAIIWADKDIYERNDCNSNDDYLKKHPSIPDFYFNYYNFEDMLILYFPIDEIQKWQKILDKRKHFKKPLHSSEYEPLFKEQILPEYEKGSFPLDNFSLDDIKNAIKNNNDKNIKFKSEFLTFLEEIIKEYLVD